MPAVHVYINRAALSGPARPLLIDYQPLTNVAWYSNFPALTAFTT
jgi:hypothetical protein